MKTCNPNRCFWRTVGLSVLFLILAAAEVRAAAQFVTGFAPDWNQPYRYTPASPNGGPGPDPIPNVANQWNAWCAPCSGANLAGHWADARGVPVADATNFPASTVAWGVGPSWQDYLADKNRPAVQVVAGSLPYPATDIGWYMDTNRGIPYDLGGGFMGGYFLNTTNHVGTYLKDIHVGLQNFLNSVHSLVSNIYWRTGTQGLGYAAGVNPTGLPAALHPNQASAFAEVKAEINANRTLILSFRHWNILASAFTLAPAGATNEAAFGGTYYTWGGTPPSTNAEDETWNFYDNDAALGHAVTAVGYIPAGDIDDKGPLLGLGPTDWVIVHDNWSTTPRNVIVPFDWNRWVANTTALP